MLSKSESRNVTKWSAENLANILQIICSYYVKDINMIIVLCQMLIYSLHDKPYRNILLTNNNRC